MSGDYMSIDIKNVTANQTSTSANKKSDLLASERKSEQSPSGTNTPQVGQDSVSLSAQSKVVSRLVNELSSAPAPDTSRIQALRSAIASGEYTVSADKIASSMLGLDFGYRSQNNDN